ncbi:MAG TPA: acetamidase, partial [Beijerinckiaceae bacterium]|nr:acetamidase [Beijerinckiaceae bacterium]
MCAGDDRNCPQFDLHRQKLLDDLGSERRGFLKGAFVSAAGAAALTGGTSLVAPAAAQTAAARQGKPSHHSLPVTAETVHWGYFS